MQKRTWLVLIAMMGIVFSPSARGAIDFHRHWRIAEAERMFSRKNYTEARSEFKDLANSAVDPGGQAVLAARAAIALGYQEGCYEKALEEVARITNQPVADYALVTLLDSQRNWTGITNRFGDTAFADWPAVQLPTATGTQDMRIALLLARAQAFTRTGAFQQAERDLEKAVELCSDSRARIRMLRDLADLRQKYLDDADGAYDANMRIVAGGRGGAICYAAAMNAADYLRQNGRCDEAVAMVKSINPREIENVYWRGRVLIELGRLLRDAGRTTEAADAFQEVVRRAGKGSDGQLAEQRRTAAFEAAVALSAAGRTTEAMAAYRRLLAMPGITDAQREQAEAALQKR